MLRYLIFLLLAAPALSNVDKRPNFVIILTDDQDVVMDGMTPMKSVERFIGSEGITFTNSYVTSPICCPSRASLLTGLYVHNHKTQNNSLSGGCYSTDWRRKEHRVFANALQNAGYDTFYAGKYLNQYGVKGAGGPDIVPPGWTDWHGLVGNSVYYDYVMSNNGVPTHLTDRYLTDVIRDLSISYIENQTESRPFLMVVAPPAPHQPFTPAPRHKGVYKNTTLVKHPNFNVAAEDKHWLIRMPPSPLPATMLPELERVFQSRWETLLAVDEMVADIVGALDDVAKLDNTYVIYTSDNGYHIGQFSQVYDKRQPYESDIKVPLLIRGPGLKRNVTNPQPVLNIDLAPTILKLARLDHNQMDGRPIDFEGEKEVKERYMLVEYYGEGRDGSVDPKCPWKYDSDNLAQCYPEYDCKCQDSKNNTFACLRHIAQRLNMKYCVFDDHKHFKKRRRWTFGKKPAKIDYYTKLARATMDGYERWKPLRKERNGKTSTNFAEMYDLSADPYELDNIIEEEFQAIITWYNNYLSKMLKCQGAANCDQPYG